MARLQQIVSLPNLVLGAAGAAIVADTSLYVKSVTIQSVSTNTGLVKFGDNTSQTIELAVGKSAVIYGDNMDNGTTARLHLASIYALSSVPGDELSIIALENL